MLSKDFYDAKETIKRSGILHLSYVNDKLFSKEEIILLRIYFHANNANKHLGRE